ncbi:sugar ABC transporter permease [Euzebya sp.]|uniref:ABC transporter permease subunit n=1 Tax=Euzebya sp. TaxID=1971409 RepID=UPI0035126F60
MTTISRSDTAVGEAQAPGWLSRHPNLVPTGSALLIFLAMVAYGQIAYGGIIQYSTVSNLLINNAHLVILAIGMTFVILTGGIDLSVGAILAFSSVAGVLLANAGLDPYLCMVVMVLLGTLTGLASGVLIHFFGMPPFIATLAMMFLTRGLASTLSTIPERLDTDSPIRDVAYQFKIIDGERVNDLAITPGVVIAAVIVVAGLFLLHRTRFGRTVYAIGGSEQSADLMGLAVARTKIWVYVISGTLAGVATVVYTARLGSAQNITGIGWELDAIAAAVVGGTLLTGGSGFLVGSVIGSLVLGLMTVLITRDGSIPAEMTTIITGGILFIFVLLQRAIRRRS